MLTARPVARVGLGVAFLVAAASPHAREAERAAQNLDAFVEEMKASGFVAKSLRSHGVTGAAIAPPGPAR